MKSLFLAVFAAGALVQHVAFASWVSAPPSSNVSFNIASDLDGRRLEVLTVDKICKKKDGSPLRGRRQLYGRRFQLGGVFARCNKQHKPKCYVDDGTSRRKHKYETVDCAKALAVIKKLNADRRLGSYETEVVEEGKWPEGVVCYNLMDTKDKNLEALYEAKKNQLHTLIFDVMSAYERNTGVHFKPISTCTETEHCGGCLHFVNFEFEVKDFDKDYDTSESDPDVEDFCLSTIGYMHGESTRLDRLRELWAPVIQHNSIFLNMLGRMGIVYDNRFMSYQSVTLSPKCWTTEAIGHEIGHTLGLFHDHQRFDREVILKWDKVQRAEAQDDFEIIPEDEVACCEYDRKSIMHYNDEALCLPKPGLDPRTFCDAYEEEDCIKGEAEKHCADNQDDLKRDDDHMPTPGDVDAVRRLYSRNTAG